MRLDDPVAKYLPWFQVKPAGTTTGRSRSSSCSATAPGCRARPASTGPRSSFRPTEELRGLMPERRRRSRRGPLEVFEPRVLVAGMVVESGERPEWADYLSAHIFDAARHDASSVDENVPGLAIGYGRRMPDGSRRRPVHRRSRHGARHRPHIDRRGHGEVRLRAVPQGPDAAARRSSSTGSLREMHRVRSLEDNWTRAMRSGSRCASRRQGYVSSRRQLSRLQTNTMLSLAASRRHRPDQRR